MKWNYNQNKNTSKEGSRSLVSHKMSSWNHLNHETDSLRSVCLFVPDLKHVHTQSFDDPRNHLFSEGIICQQVEANHLHDCQFEQTNHFDNESEQL